MDRAELKARIQDFEQFAPTLLKVPPKEGSARVPFRMNAAQTHLHHLLEAELKEFGQIRALIPKARKMGVSTYVGARFYHKVVTHKGLRAIVIAHRDDITTELFRLVKAYHNDIPDEFRSSTSYSNAYELVFTTMKSAYRVSTAKGGGIGRGDTFQLMHISEVALIKNIEDISSGLVNAVPDAPGTEIIEESTGNGQSGMFYSECMAALRANNKGVQRVHFLPWTLDTSYATREEFIPSSWRPSHDFVQYATLHQLTKGQLYWFWRRNAEIAAKNGGSSDNIHRLTRQEYPIVVQECFLADSTFDFFPPSLVQGAMTRRPVFYGPRILGIDPATDGNDACFVCDRQGTAIGQKVFGYLATPDQNVQADWVVDTARRLEIDSICVDSTGLGIGLVSALRLRLGNSIPVIAVNFGSNAVTKPREYGNRRAEIHHKFSLCLQNEETSLPNDQKLVEELSKYKWGQSQCRRDDQGRLYVTKKEEIRKEIGRSPDRADAVCVTFAVDDSQIWDVVNRKRSPISIVS